MDGFQAVVRKTMTELGWAEPLWLETRPDDTGERLAREAVRPGVDLVLASGGDGTITACCCVFPQRPNADGLAA
jgi:diacylglycerol kinase family enzyme